MFSRANSKTALGLILAFASLLVFSQMAAADDLTHVLKGVVKSVDKGTKTMVVKSADGTEHTVKWTDKTTLEGGKDVGEGVAEGTKVSVKYTENGGEKTAVAVKKAGKATGKAME